MQKFPIRAPDLTSSVDKCLEEYKEKNELDENQKNMYTTENMNITSDERYSIECAFKDACVAGKFQTGHCPCELIR